MALELIAQLYMVCAMVDYKRQVYFCNAVYEQFTYVISMQARTQGGLRGLDRIPNFCSLKLILSLNIEY